MANFQTFRSQAEPEVLAEYVAVLFKSDEPEDKMRENAVSELQDFLQDSAEPVYYLKSQRITTNIILQILLRS